VSGTVTPGTIGVAKKFAANNVRCSNGSTAKQEVNDRRGFLRA